MRILHVSEVHWGGVVSLIQLITTEQVRRGHEVTLLSPPMTPPVVAPDGRHWSLQRRNPVSFGIATRQLRAAIEETRPDVVHLHSFLAGFVGRQPYLRRPLPTVYQPHAWSFDLRGDVFSRRAVMAWERSAGRRTQLMVTNCQDEIDEGRRAGVSTPGHVIGVAVDTNWFAGADDVSKESSRQRLGIRSGHMLLCIGRLVRQKGQDLLVAAWERQRPDDTTLVLLGPGDAEPLRRLAPRQWGETIRAVGETSDVRPWLAASDALVLSSRYETVGVVIAEAMSTGRPVIATDVNGAAEVICGGDLPAAGRVVPVGDMTALLAEATSLLSDPTALAGMSQAARLRSERLFSSEAVVDRLDEAYSRAIRSR